MINKQTFTRVEDFASNMYLEVGNEGFFSVIIPSDGTNLVQNPKFLLDNEDANTATSFAWNTTIIRVDDNGPSGDGYNEVIALATERITYRTNSTALAGNNYTFSVALRSNDNNCQLSMSFAENNLVQFGQLKVITLTNQWQRYEITASPTVDEAQFAVILESINDCNYDVADWQIEAGIEATTYFNGDSIAGYGEDVDVYGWNGLPNQSISYRQDTYTGGFIFNLKEEVGFRLIAIEGLLGIPEMDVNLTPLITADRSLFRCSTIKEREFTLVGRIHSCNNLCDLLCKHNALAASIFTQNRPIRLRFQSDKCEDCSGCVELDAILESEETDIVNHFVTEVELNFIQADPSIRQCVTDSISISAEATDGESTNATFVGNNGNVDPLVGYDPNPGFDPLLQNGAFNFLDKNLYLLWDGVTGDGLNNGGRVTQYNGTSHVPIGSLYGGSSTNRARTIASRGRYVVVGGNFTSIQSGTGTACNTVVDAPDGCTGRNIGLFDIITNTWYDIGSFTTVDPNEGVNSIVWISDTEIAVGGQFLNYTHPGGGVTITRNIAILDISTLTNPVVSTLGANNELFGATQGVIDLAYCENTGDLAIASDAFDDVGPIFQYNIMFYNTFFNQYDISQDYSLGYENLTPSQGSVTNVKYTSNCDLIAVGDFIGNGAIIPFEDNYEGIAILRNNGEAGYDFPTHVGGWSIDTSLTPGAGSMELEECNGQCIVTGDNLVQFYTRLDGLPAPVFGMCGGLTLTPRNAQFTQVDAAPLVFSPTNAPSTAACDITTAVCSEAPNNPGIYFGIQNGSNQASVSSTNGDVYLCAGTIATEPYIQIYGQGYIYEITNSANNTKLVLNRNIQEDEILTIDLTNNRQQVFSNFIGPVRLDVGSTITAFRLEPGTNTIIPLWDTFNVNDDARVVVKYKQSAFGLQVACELCGSNEIIDRVGATGISSNFDNVFSDTPVEEQPPLPEPL